MPAYKIDMMFDRNLLPFLVAFMFIAFFAYPADSFHTTKISSELSEKSINEPESSARVIVKMKNTKDNTFSATSAKIKSSELLENKKILMRSGNSDIVAAEIPLSALDYLASDENVEYVEEDMPVHAFLSESVPLIGADSVWQKQINGINITGAGTSICIIDTGVDYTHPDLGGCTNETFLASNCAKVIAGYDFVNNDTDPMDDNGHGTHVAGIAAANGILKGVAPDAKIIAIKALDYIGSGYESDVASGIYWCISNSTKFNISVISMSLGGNEVYSSYCDNENINNALFAEAINSAIAENISVVIATGNNGASNGISSPACIENATRAGASTKTDNIAYLTNRGNNFSDMLLAPGMEIYSTYKNSRHTTLSGTSMAAPHVSGAIALLSEAHFTFYNKSQTPQYFKDLLNATGRQINDTATNMTFSRIDLFNGIKSPKNGSFINANHTELLAHQLAVSLINFSVDEENNVSACYDCSGFAVSLSNLSDGIHNITVYGNDPVFAPNNTMAYFTIDTIAPSVVFEHPKNNSYSGNNWILINLSASDANFANATVSLFNSSGIANFTQINESGEHIANWTNLSEGIYFFNATAHDLAGNSNSTETRKITIDLSPPNITNITVYPANASFGQNVTINYFITDVSPTESEITVAHGNISEPANVSKTGEFYTAVFSNITDAGEYNITIFTKDSLNHTSNASAQFFVNASAPLSVNSNESEVCGNGKIDAGETCITCPQDSGACPPPKTEEKPAAKSSSGSGGWGAGIIIPKKNITNYTNTSVLVNESRKNNSASNVSFATTNPPIAEKNITEKLAAPEITEPGIKIIPENKKDAPAIATGFSISNYLRPITTFMDWLLHLLRQLL